MIHCGKITKMQLLTIEKAKNRQSAIDNNMNINWHRVVQSKRHKDPKYKKDLFN